MTARDVRDMLGLPAEQAPKPAKPSKKSKGPSEKKPGSCQRAYRESALSY